VIVLMHVVVGLVCELAHGTTGVVMRHVPVIVGMDLGGVMVFMLLIADDDLLRLDRHAVTSFAVALRSSRHARAYLRRACPRSPGRSSHGEACRMSMTPPHGTLLAAETSLRR
jgi:hypothetical protein